MSNPPPFSHIAIIGLGLLGGSIGLAVAEHLPGATTTGYDLDPATRQRAVADYLRTRLTDPAGLGSMVAEFDAAGTMEGGSMVWANARDWARFGELLRNQGTVGEGAKAGAQILPREWIAFMTGPSPANPGYGGQIWLNRPQAEGVKELFADRGPPDLFACVGHQGQYILVWPRQGLTVVRLGKTDDANRPALLTHLADIVNLFGGQ